MPGSNSSLVRPLVWVLLAALIGIYLLYDWYSGHLAEQLVAKDAQIAEAAVQVQERDARISDLRREATQLEERIAALSEQHSGEKQQLSDLHSKEKQDLADRIAALEQGNSKLEEDIEVLRRTDARALAEEQDRTAAAIEERDRGIAAFKALQGQYEMSVAKAEDLQTELAGLQQVIADSAMEHRAQIEELERHLNERVKLAKATPKDSELMRAAQKAGLLPEAVALDDETAAFCTNLAETSASAQTALDALQAEFSALRDEQSERIAVLEGELTEARAALARSGEQTESTEALGALQERLAQTEAEHETAKAEAVAALEEAKATAAAQLADAQARIEALSEELKQSVAPDALAALQARSEAAEAALAQTKDDLARRIEESEEKVATLAEQLRSEQAAKAKVAQEKDALAVELNAALDGARAELADLQTELTAVRASSLQTGSKALDEASERVAALEARIAEERSKADRVRASARQEADRKVAEVRELYRRFSQLGGAHTERGVLLKLADTELTFQPAKATLTGDDFPTLDRVAALLETYPDLDVRIEGHTDSLGDAAANLALSQQRAEAVKQALIERGVAPERLTAQGLGPERPIADNATTAGRAQNRRVEVYVSED
ncbi:OmpA family protein [Thiocapsa marina]|uniref:OmpA/MotB domain protein n=1 Tax=Thiocapsa marina 5811 TaxID=768671 RepID=F9U8W5_9GAMM|nr:OmpA family protein [Thiocapsa marina]EGV19223.1 OmpA/MotB domain protein [Thiocapsa marina 5811]